MMSLRSTVVRPQHIDQRSAGLLASLLQERADDVADWLIDHGVDPAEMLMELPMVSELEWNWTMKTLPDKQKLREAFDQVVCELDQR
jgi:hypothetical protein